jgi:AcrR family transcriptional regulator
MEGNNKEKILSVAATLFAESGYDNVSMRQIAERVGIKASSIYNHFSGKEQILEVLFERFKNDMEEMIFRPLDVKNVEDIDIKCVLKNNLEQSMEIFHNPYMEDIIKVLRNEQFVNERCRKFMFEIFVEKPVEIFENFFRKLMEAGRIKECNVRFLAEEYRAFSVYLFYKSTLIINSVQEELINDKKQMECHIDFFVNAILI